MPPTDKQDPENMPEHDKEGDNDRGGMLKGKSASSKCVYPLFYFFLELCQSNSCKLQPKTSLMSPVNSSKSVPVPQGLHAPSPIPFKNPVIKRMSAPGS
jgi:hypothetical protein